MRTLVEMQRTPILVLCMLVLTATMAAPGVATLCVGSDGHAAVELLADGCCVGSAADRPGRVDGLAVDDGSCGDCTDLELVAPVLERTRFVLRGPADAPAAFGTGSHGPAAHHRLGCPTAAADLPTPAPGLDLLASVVLRT
jgi:hypothetical protein